MLLHLATSVVHPPLNPQACPSCCLIGSLSSAFAQVGLALSRKHCVADGFVVLHLTGPGRPASAVAPPEHPALPRTIHAVAPLAISFRCHGFASQEVGVRSQVCTPYVLGGGVGLFLQPAGVVLSTVAPCRWFCSFGVCRFACSASGAPALVAFQLSPQLCPHVCFG